MSKLVLKSLSILLGAFFIFLGVLKVTPRISKDLHKDLRAEYAKYAKVSHHDFTTAEFRPSFFNANLTYTLFQAFPLAKTLDFHVPSKWYRRSVGGIEVACGAVLLLVPHRMRRGKNAANWALLAVKVLNAYSHWAVDDEFERTAPTLVFLLMLGCRLVVDWQVAKREREERGEERSSIEDKKER